MSEYSALAGRVGELMGGPTNVVGLENCTTRLRFVVKDRSQVRVDQLRATDGVIQVVESGGQVQVVIGTHVEDVKKELLGLSGWHRVGDSGAGSASGGGVRGAVDRLFDFLAGTFQPLLMPLIGTAMLSVVVILAQQLGWLDPASSTATLLAASTNALFYFLPIFVGFTASKKLGANPFVGATIAAVLLEPNFVALGATGEVSSIYGIPLYLYSYASTMLPAMLAAVALAYFERGLKRVLPQAAQMLVIPALALAVLVPLTALVFGPIGVVVATGVADGVSWLGATVPLLYYVVVAATWVFMVALGLHWALLPIVIVELTTTGSSSLFAAAGGYQFAMVGVALGVVLRARRDRATKTTATAALLAAGIGGVTEPTLYGIVLRFKRVIPAVVIGGASAGLVLGLFKVTGSAIVLSPIFGIPAFAPVVGQIIAFAVGTLVAAGIVLLRGYDTPGAGVEPAAEPELVDARPGEAALAAPLSGRVVPLAEVPDPIFSAGLLGHGVAIVPDGARVVAPADGTVVVAPDTAHAVGIRTAGGVEVLIHVGIDTVKLGGDGFTLKVAVGDRVASGQELLAFDAARITARGYSIVTPVVVTNAGSRLDVVAHADGAVVEGDALLSVTPRAEVVA